MITPTILLGKWIVTTLYDYHSRGSKDLEQNCFSGSVRALLYSSPTSTHPTLCLQGDDFYAEAPKIALRVFKVPDFIECDSTAGDLAHEISRTYVEKVSSALLCARPVVC